MSPEEPLLRWPSTKNQPLTKQLNLDEAMKRFMDRNKISDVAKFLLKQSYQAGLTKLGHLGISSQATKTPSNNYLIHKPTTAIHVYRAACTNNISSFTQDPVPIQNHIDRKKTKHKINQKILVKIDTIVYSRCELFTFNLTSPNNLNAQGDQQTAN